MTNIKSVLKSLVILVSVVLLSAFAGPKLVKIKLDNGISFRIPQEWRPMDDLDLRERYPSVRAPIAAYTSQDRLVDFSINISSTMWPDEDIDLAQKFFKSSFYNLFDRVDMIDEGIRESGGHKFVYFEFESTIKGNPRELGQNESIMSYNYVQYLIQPGRTLAFSFHCPRRMRADGEPIAKSVMQSIRVKKK